MIPCRPWDDTSTKARGSKRFVANERALMPAVARHLGLAEIAEDWSGVDAVLPLLERMRADGAMAFIKLDGGRTGPADGGQYTILVSGGPLNGEFLRADTETLEDGLARVIVGYARKCWQSRARGGSVRPVLVIENEP